MYVNIIMWYTLNIYIYLRNRITQKFPFLYNNGNKWEGEGWRERGERKLKKLK